MTFEELEQELPNGFHDAAIKEIRMDFVGRSILVGMEILVGLPGSPNQEEYRPGTLKVLFPHLFFLEPPDPRYPFVPDGSPLNVGGDSVRVGQNPQVDRLLEVLPKNATTYRFFLEEWNSFLYLAGASVEFCWDGEQATSD